jgi:hypothetical protein
MIAGRAENSFPQKSPRWRGGTESSSNAWKTRNTWKSRLTCHRLGGEAARFARRLCRLTAARVVTVSSETSSEMEPPQGRHGLDLWSGQLTGYPVLAIRWLSSPGERRAPVWPLEVVRMSRRPQPQAAKLVVSRTWAQSTQPETMTFAPRKTTARARGRFEPCAKETAWSDWRPGLELPRVESAYL